MGEKSASNIQEAFQAKPKATSKATPSEGRKIGQSSKRGKHKTVAIGVEAEEPTDPSRSLPVSSQRPRQDMKSSQSSKKAKNKTVAFLDMGDTVAPPQAEAKARVTPNRARTTAETTTQVAQPQAGAKSRPAEKANARSSQPARKR